MEDLHALGGDKARLVEGEGGRGWELGEDEEGGVVDERVVQYEGGEEGYRAGKARRSELVSD